MKTSHLCITALVAMLFGSSALAQWEKSPPAQWNEKDCKKILSDSPWAQTQTFADPNRNMGTARSGDTSSTSNIVEDYYASFRVRFFSAKPVRQALARQIELQLKEKMTEEQAGELKKLADGEFRDFVVITVLVDASKPTTFSQQAAGALRRLTTEELKNNTYLQAKGGKRVYLQEYQQPRRDGFGARLIFPRMVDGQPIIPENSEVALNSDLNGSFSLRVRFKTKEMMYQGKLDY